MIPRAYHCSVRKQTNTVRCERMNDTNMEHVRDQRFRFTLTELLFFCSVTYPRAGEMNNSQLLFLFLVIFCAVRCMNGSCAPFNNCSGHGKCGRNSKCVCDDGWGSESDLALYKAPDCSQRTCPNDIAWSDLPKSNGTAHVPAECSNAGICNRKTGKCECFSGFTGKACNRRTCLNDCSGHGRCVSKRRAANMDDAQPIGELKTL